MMGITVRFGKVLHLFLAAALSACPFLADRIMAADKENPVPAGAVWQPHPGELDRIRERCSSPKVLDFSECFASSMAPAGASADAVAFTRHTGNMAYLRGFREEGRVDVAYVFYPFRANENYGWFLVNGDPPFVDVDDQSSLAFDQLETDPVYGGLKAQFPDISLWPDDRFSMDLPKSEKASDGGQRFTVTYRLQNLCHACELLGFADFVFRFDASGHFQGTQLTGVRNNGK
jgi:hypothetical protein